MRLYEPRHIASCTNRILSSNCASVVRYNSMIESFWLSGTVDWLSDKDLNWIVISNPSPLVELGTNRNCNPLVWNVHPEVLSVPKLPTSLQNLLPSFLLLTTNHWYLLQNSYLFAKSQHSRMSSDPLLHEVENSFLWSFALPHVTVDVSPLLFTCESSTFCFFDALGGCKIVRYFLHPSKPTTHNKIT